MSLFLVPATRENLESSIEQAVPPSRLEHHVPAATLAELLIRGGPEGIRCWAMTTTLRTRFNAMRPGDIVLLSEKDTGRFTHFARVTFKLENKALGDALWPFKGDKSWELIYFLNNILRIDVPKADLVTRLNYDAGFAVAGTTLVPESKLQTFESTNGPLLQWLGLMPAQTEPLASFGPTVAEGDASDYSSTHVIAEARRRVGQDAFASRVKANYGMSCAMCGIVEKDFLVAGHISPWADDIPNRLNPANGICLCVLHDRAFEKGYLVLDEGLCIRMTALVLPSSPLGQHLKPVDGRPLRLPSAAPPSSELLAQHRKRFLKKASP